MRAICASLSLLVCLLGASSYRDVPVGYCHDCEVTCFEDCVVKYDREIIQPDVTGAILHSGGDSRVEAAMKNKLYGVVLKQNKAGPAAKASVSVALPKLSSSYRACLKEDKCPCNQKTKGRGSSFLATACNVGDQPCALGCINKTLDTEPGEGDEKPGKNAQLQTTARVFPGPLDENDAAIPWSNSVHPVVINSFATGRQDLEQCYKSCLAATCGCYNPPGLERLDAFHNAIKKNDESKEPVEDTTPNWQYKRPDMMACAKGMQGKKVTQGMYADLVGGAEGWVEVCSDDFFTQQGLAADAGKKNCDNPKALLAGCIWDTNRGSCVYGLKPNLINCYTRYLDDNKL